MSIRVVLIKELERKPHLTVIHSASVPISPASATPTASASSPALEHNHHVVHRPRLRHVPAAAVCLSSSASAAPSPQRPEHHYRNGYYCDQNGTGYTGGPHHEPACSSDTQAPLSILHQEGAGQAAAHCGGAPHNPRAPQPLCRPGVSRILDVFLLYVYVYALIPARATHYHRVIPRWTRYNIVPQLRV